MSKRIHSLFRKTYFLSHITTTTLFAMAADAVKSEADIATTGVETKTAPAPKSAPLKPDSVKREADIATTGVETKTAPAPKSAPLKPEAYNLTVKAEFLPKTLPGNNEESVTSEGTRSAPAERTSQADNRSSDRRLNSSDRKGRRGRNKKRPRDAKIDSGDKACMMTMRGEVCPYGPEKCRYSHDLKLMLANREPDLVCIKGGCPRFKNRGMCEFGVTCRVGSDHINMATGENIRKEEPADYKPVVNILSKDVQTQLRKKTYPFQCKRHFEKKKDEHAEGESAAEVDTSPLPLPGKTRKLIDFRNKVYIAPLTTVGNLPFRRILKGLGADITCGEMAVSENLLKGQGSEWALLKRHPCEDVFGVQIAAAHPDQFTRVCELIDTQCDVDFVDLNLGCPIDLICDKGAGSALMLRDKKLKASLMGISGALSCPFTVKMRTGWNERDPIAHKLVHKIQSWEVDGLAALMVHGRSRLQRYSRLANWDYISKVATGQNQDLPQIPLIGNGDIFSYTDYEDKVAREGIQATAMLARGALIKPWLPTEIKEKRHWDISASERLDILKDFARYGLEHWGSDQQGVNATRRFLLEWLSFLYRYVPVAMLEVVPQQMNLRPPQGLCGRSDLETLMLSSQCKDWIKLSEMLLGPVPDGFQFEPKHKASGFAKPQ